MTYKLILNEVLEIDAHNINGAFQILQDYDLAELFLAMPELLSNLEIVVKQELSTRNTHPFIRTAPDGTDVPATDMVMRFHMLLSATQQFTLGAADFLRGHKSDAHSRIRRAVEGAGIAHLSLSEPEIGELYFHDDRNKYRDRTKTNKLFPASNPLAAALKGTIDISSRLIHNNCLSFAHRMKHDFSTDGNNWKIEIQFDYHDDYPGNIPTVVNFVLWMLRAAERVARLLAASFEIKDADWHQTLDQYRVRLDGLYIKHGPMIRATFEEVTPANSTVSAKA